MSGKEPKKMGQMNLPQSSQCQDKQWCIGVYLTPWCPYCKRSVKFVKGLEKYVSSKYDNVGVMVVMGDPRDKDLDAFAAQFSSETRVLDPDYKYYSALIVQAVPTWFALEENEFRFLQAGVFRLPDGGRGIEVFINDILELDL